MTREKATTKVALQLASGQRRTFEVVDVSVGTNLFVLEMPDGKLRGWNIAMIESFETEGPIKLVVEEM